GPPMKPSRESTGSRICRRRHHSLISSRTLSAVGASNAIIKNLKTKSVLIILKAEVGAVFTTTRRCASLHMALSSPNAAFFPLPTSAPLYRNLPYPATSNRADLPVRVERHVPASITSRRLAIAAQVIPRLVRCPTCLHPKRKYFLSLRL